CPEPVFSYLFDQSLSQVGHGDKAVSQHQQSQGKDAEFSKLTHIIQLIHNNLLYRLLIYICIPDNVSDIISKGLKKQQQLYKGSLNTIIMKLLEQNGKMYGYEITQKVKEITDGEMNITEGALYPALHKMEAEGFLDVEMDRVDGRIRKYYKLT